MARRFCLSCGRDLDPGVMSGCCSLVVPAEEIDWSASRGPVDIEDRDREAFEARRSDREQQRADIARWGWE